MTTTIRPFDVNADRYDALLRVASVGTLRRAKEYAWLDGALRAAGRALTRLVAVDNDGVVIGYAHSHELLDYPAEGRRIVEVEVRGDSRGRGVGRRLLAALGPATATDTRETVSFASADDPAADAMLDALGCEVFDVVHELELELAGERPRPRALPDGLVARSLADLREAVPDWERRFYELSTSAQASAPSKIPYVKPSLEMWRAKHLQASNALPDAVVVALDEDRWVAHTELRDGGGGVLDTHMTAVLPAYRRRGLALALKGRALFWAAGAGYRAVATSVLEDNLAMRAINDALGFERTHTWNIARRTLSDEERERWARGELT